MKQRARRSIALFMMALMALLSFTSVSAEPPANPDFQRTWERTDAPVSDLVVSRTWMWGPSANTLAVSEQYADSPDGWRTVQYFDKSRMEINDPDAMHDLWYVTNGLLVNELITGQMQVGDAEYEPRSAADIPVAGDADDTNGPTYATLAGVLDDDPLAVGVEISWRINAAGNITVENGLTGHGVTAAHWDEETNHTVASPFWDFMNSSGTVWENGSYVTANLFENPFYATGRPITEAYWATVKVSGDVQDVLLQCFERRCLTYTPRNADGWKVEAGNVGQHYYAWRYEQTQPQPGQAWLHLVSQDDGGTLGCGDTLVPVIVEIDPVSHDRDVVAQALDALFAIDDEFYGESGLYNALHNSNLTVESSVISDGVATVHITGEYSVAGICDEPRFVEQIRQTVLAFGGVNTANIFINDVPLDEIFSQGEVQTANVYLLSVDDGGPVGCGDTLVPVEVSFPADDDPVAGALTALFAIDEGLIGEGEDELYNGLHQSDLAVESVVVEDGLAIVHITGSIIPAGTCDDPRLKEQIRATVLQFDDVESAEIFVNDVALDDLFDMEG